MLNKRTQLGLSIVLVAAGCAGGSEDTIDFAAIFAAMVNGQSAPTDEGAEAPDGGTTTDAGVPNNYAGPEFCVDLYWEGAQEATACNDGGWTVRLDETTDLDPDIESGYDATVRTLTQGWTASDLPSPLRVHNGSEQTWTIAFTSDAPPCDPNPLDSPCHQCDPANEDCDGDGVIDCAVPGGSCDPQQRWGELDVHCRALTEIGEPVSPCEIQLQGDWVDTTWTTDAAGDITIVNLPIERILTVRAGAETYGDMETTVVLQARDRRDLIFPLQPLADREVYWTEWLPPVETGETLPQPFPVFLDGAAVSCEEDEPACLECTSLTPAIVTIASDCSTYTGVSAGIGQVVVRVISADITSAPASVEVTTIE